MIDLIEWAVALLTIVAAVREPITAIADFSQRGIINIGFRGNEINPDGCKCQDH